MSLIKLSKLLANFMGDNPEQVGKRDYNVCTAKRYKNVAFIY